MSPNVASAQSRWARRRAARSSAVLGTRKHLLTGSPVAGDGKVITSRCSGDGREVVEMGDALHGGGERRVLGDVGDALAVDVDGAAVPDARDVLRARPHHG